MTSSPPKSIKAAGDFSRVADSYRKYRPGYPQDLFNRVLEYVPSGPAVTMLDLGCGTGNVVRSLAHAYPTILGIDPSLKMLRQATTHRLDRAGPVLWVQGFAETIPLAPSTIDLITAGQAVHWFDRDLFVVEAKRILKPGGVVAMFWEGAMEGESYRTLFHSLMDDCLGQPGKTGPVFAKYFEHLGVCASEPI